ncbi:hypothetical protein H311_02023 [Anncaliia algerae PRA109]|nr:hypothetical protein H311_02023 [Anncaliia algerae PRA109]
MTDKDLNFVLRFFKSRFLNLADTRCIKNPLDKLFNDYFVVKNYKIKTSDDINLAATIMEPILINQETIFILFCHGTGSNRHSLRDLFEVNGVLNRNICALILDYREFAENDGSFDILHVNYDVDACVKFFNRKYKPNKIHLIGHSLGTAILLEYVKFVKINERKKFYDKIVLFAPFSSLIEVCEQFYIFKIACLIPGFKKYVVKKYGYLSDINVTYADKNTVLIIHGRNDSLIPYTQGLKIVKEGNTDVLITDDDHDSVLRNSYAWDKVFMFFD